MNQRKLAKLRRELEALRRGAHKAREFESLARRLGQERVKRGKEPMWESKVFDELYVLAIPHHGGRDLSPGVRHSVLAQLEDDIFAWEERLLEDDDGPDSEA